MGINRIKKYLYLTLVIFTSMSCLILLKNGIFNSDWHDFDVFYNSARAALEGRSIYFISTSHQLPFWYFPWTAWFYIPLAVWPKEIALILYKCLTVLCAIFVVIYLTHYYNPDLKILDKVLILSLIIPMTLQLMLLGQMDYILLALIVIMMIAIEQKKDILAGLLFPLLWMKPHLLIVFTLFAFWRAGKRTVLVSLATSVVLFGVETFLSPGWPLEMLNLLRGGTQTVISLGFISLPILLGFPQNMVGTANLPITILLICLAILIVWKFRSLPTFPLLSLSLVASLFCAPRAYAYDLTLLIPVLIWLTAKEFRSWIWLWFVAAAIPFLTNYSSYAGLLTILTFLLAIVRSYKILGSPTGSMDQIS
jgi:hypothetical protein